MIQDEQELKDILTKSWSQKTSSKWTKECPSCGQCSVTALVIQDRYGGSILKTKVGGSWHFYNSINGGVYDFTSDQFPQRIVYQNIPSSRQEAFLDTNEEQYLYLRSAFSQNINSFYKET
ncbi:YunG family protein [Bacillus atrophaeus]|uniref:YunG family protein n=1 Tax=Bacillus atrophaeus TaxID=1452 RepID=UPI0007C453AF|nr:hypothetical protein [Bacillus atrophaeus]MBU5261828.1 hypothetical protein [Bacillus atrophaeus]MDS9996258.1 hypothetical protein [Bacillus atrophaeus]QUF64619.1 hypothetical protein KCX77_16290 [Bacillus atrophaeus]WFE13464.1 hypothetical protein P4829_16530 [Bacillus atrophaeus]